MDRRTELTAFLRSRRARIHPDDAGVRTFGDRRRVPGLRREELAWLAGIGTDYYVRLEQGRNGTVSADVLDALARALKLAEVERVHLHNLARPARRPPRRGAEEVAPGLQRLLDTMGEVPAYVVGRGTDVLAWNRPARLVFADFAALPPERRNMARLVFLDPATRELYRDWEVKARDVIARLRLDLGRCPDDVILSALIVELLGRSPDFHELWADQDVLDKTHGTYRLRHPRFGGCALAYRALRLPEEPDQLLVTYTVEPGSSLETALRHDRVRQPEPGRPVDPLHDQPSRTRA
ncbi:helix-turn-helix transcriptional regulator [Micromonospora sp. NBC_01699]|uniref:helix-turn-helix transcriptional regulator n=1 Tax=Micromonospora sp. NBC_01699 TaxID=2975984 RepID=UPI002E299D48|nr:helix-turn-helix transcriptional regulator [Micromonospora sp. NBC_01699]